MCTKLMYLFSHFFTIPLQFLYKKKGRQPLTTTDLTVLSTIPPAQPNACHKTDQTRGQGPPSLSITKKRHHNHLLARLKDRPTKPATARTSTTIICPTKLREQNQPHMRTKIFHTVQTSSIIITLQSQNDSILQRNHTMLSSRQDSTTATNIRHCKHRASHAQTNQGQSNAALTD